MNRYEYKPNSENDKLITVSGAEHERLDSLISNTVEQLELVAKPDRSVHTIRGADFGRYGDSRLSMEHSDHDGYHEGVIIYADNDDKSKSFTLSNTYREQQGWKYGNRKCTTKNALHLIERSWPMNDEESGESPIETVRQLSRNDTPVEPDFPFSVIEDYAARTGTGHRDSEKTWVYHDISSSQPGDTRVESVIVTDKNSTEDGSSETSLSIVVPYEIDDEITPLTCVLTRDSFGDISLEASYLDLDREANEPVQVPISIQKPEAVYEEVASAVDAMIKEKSTGISEARL